ncbi:hypothetical protein A5784_14765 [Mycobacterium sp. 852013-50091_SCH5140682]|uniref:DUF262 domain-containing protein n=1 Tax=Mycobacterium sp. 852013-50091_SCH5140682 TaxID=1834109 RepID=UPI0007EC1504|nr:DUF262 domain-containing protein [Mycobacterium sp. 852013-50091_SCH5140682]OBC03466.1 hypothetical protein A5784_14765 [Mycobacterium sp. 852013-50091_SCH5140682]
MNEILAASSSSAGDLFSSSTFTIPMYQREYAWSSSQYEALWDDLRSSLTDQSYFLGLIILTRTDRKKEVVDGQQRLITISILSAALRDESHDRRRSALASQIHTTFLFALDYQTEIERPRIEFSDQGDGEVFEAIITSKMSSLQPDDHQMKRAYQYFRSKLQEDIDEDAFKRLGQWVEFLRERLYFAVFVHPDPASAYTVFEVINDRGKELTPADLLKNNLIANTPDDQKRNVYERWQLLGRQFDDGPPEGFVQYIRHVAILTRGYILPRDLYRTVARTSQAPNGMVNLLPELEAHLELYLQIADPTTGGPASEVAAAVYAGFNALGVTAVRPLLLAFGHDEDEPLLEVFRSTVKIAAVTSLGSANLERRFSEAAAKAVKGSDWKTQLVQLVPDRDTFINDLPRRALRKQTLQLIQRSIVQKSIITLPEGHLQLIRPKVAHDWIDITDDDFGALGRTIGNTVLTSVLRRPRNSARWDETKRNLIPTVIDDHHKSYLEKHERWTSATIAAWGSRLAEEAADVWY